MPTYHLANVVDDHLMEITHVIRGEEWLPSLALHVLLYRAFDWQEPKFAHLPLILKPTGKGKLSKRDGDKFGFPVYALDWADEKVYSGFNESGFLAEALINYMVFLGWSPGGEKEIYSLDELINDFTLEKINKSGAKFDPQKLLWINSQHIQGLNIDKLCELCEPKNKDIDKGVLKSFLKLVQPRLETINNLKEKFLYLFQRPAIDERLIKKTISEEVKETISAFVLKLGADKSLGAQEIKKLLYDCAEENSAKFGKVMGFCRACIVGKMEGPDVVEMMIFIGIEETAHRLKKFLG